MNPTAECRVMVAPTSASGSEKALAGSPLLLKTERLQMVRVLPLGLLGLLGLLLKEAGAA
jgi:hypothetical protein